MALVRCKACGRQIQVGLMPTTTCGLLLLLPLSLALVTSILLWPRFGWLSLFLAVLVFLATRLLMDHVPRSLEYLWARRIRCPGCGQRKWSYPFTEGFGL